MNEKINIVITDKNFDTKVLNGLVVKSEVNANTISIEFPKIYEGENLENKIFVIKTINANGVYFEEILPKTISDNKIILNWKIGSEYTSVSGDLRVAIFAEGTNYTLGTKTSKIFIENSPQFTAPISPEDVFEKYLKEIRVRSESASNSAEQSLRILEDMNNKIVDDFTSTAKDKALSANKGRELNDRINNIVGQTGTSNTEIVDARNSPERNTIYPTLKSRLDAVDGDIVKSKYSAPSTATAPIISIPTTAVKGKMEGNLKGNTLYNAITNGDFSQGTSGWVPSSATLSVANKVLNVTGTGTSATVGVSKLTPLNTLSKRFAKIKLRVTNANCQSILFRWSTSVVDQISIINNPVKDQWYELTGVLERNLPTLYVYHTYPDATTANGKTMEIDGNVGVFAIPITGTPYESWIADQLNNLVNGYWEGLGNSNASKTKAIGKNLFNKNNITKDMQLNADGTLAPSFGVRVVSDFIKIKKNQTYKLNNNNSNRRWCVYSSSKEFLETGFGNNPTFNNQSGSFLRFDMPKESVDICQLESGSDLTTYEPYTETELFCPVELGSVPNGVSDEFTLEGNHIQRTKEYTLQSGDIVGLTTTTNNVNVAIISNTTDRITINDLSGKIITTDKTTPLNGATLDIPESIWKHYCNPTNWGIILPKTYTTLEQAKTVLAGTKIRYQLATPIETQYPASNLIAEPSGTIYVDSAVKVIKSYTTNIALDVKIKNLISVTKVDGETRSPILLSLANVAEDGMSLTILNASSGDMYELEYETFGATLPTIQYSYPLNLNAQVQSNTEALKSVDKTLQDFLAYQNAVNAQVDLRLVLLERK